MKYNTFGISASAGIIALTVNSAMAAAVVSFEEVTVPASGYVNSSTPAGGFNLQGASFRNEYDPAFGSWSGFAISNQTNTTQGGWSNQYSAFTGGGQGGSANYAVFYTTFDTSPHINFGQMTNFAGMGASFTNTAYAGISMRDGDQFSKKFGGASGNDADWFKLTIQGFAAGSATGTFIDFYLADYRSSNNALDYIVKDWTYVDFSTLGTVDSLRFSFSSSDNGSFGMNTPAYFAMDNIAVPEPSALLCSLAGLGLVLRRKR